MQFLKQTLTKCLLNEFVFSYPETTSLYKNPFIESVQLSDIVPCKHWEERERNKPSEISTQQQLSFYKFNFRKQMNLKLSYNFFKRKVGKE